MIADRDKCPNGSHHCWHERWQRHAVFVPGGEHFDDVCCWCGAMRCRTEMRADDEGGHGPHLRKEMLKRP